MTRRELIGGLCCAGVARAAERSRVAITIDDVAWAGIPEPFRADASKRLLTAMGDRKAALFVTGSNVDSDEGRSILREWGKQGHMIANHTWSHRVYGKSMEPAVFAEDMLRCDRLVREVSGFQPFFRFPALKEGGTRERRDFMRQFLREHGYRNGSVTIDASDWYYDQRLRARLKQEPGFDVQRFREPYLAHIQDRAAYYDQLARKVTGGAIPHTLLIHFNLLNSLFLGDLLKMFRSKGWDIVDATTAFQDPIFRREPDVVPAGESLVWSLAKETGRFDAELRYPGEDDVYEKPILDRMGL